MKEKTILIGFILFSYLCEGFTQNHPPLNNEYIPQFEWLINYPIDQVYSSSIDSSGNIYVVCIDSNRPNILKFKQTGILIWHKIYDFIPGSYRILITNKMNECFYIATSNQEHDYLLSKHDTSGNILWSKVVGLGGYEEPTAMTLDNKGNIIITGHGESIYPSTCGLTIKYNPEGDTLWARKEYVNGNMVYVVNSITTDRYGNVFINGNNGIGLNNYGVMQTIKYDSLGNRK